MSDCLFCKIIAGEIPSKKIYEDELSYAFYDINPQAPFHALIIPKKHIDMIENLNEADEALVGHLVFVAKKLAKEFNFDNGFRLIFNDNVDGGQEVGHIHLHMIAGQKFGWPPFAN